MDNNNQVTQVNGGNLTGRLTFNQNDNGGLYEASGSIEPQQPETPFSSQNLIRPFNVRQLNYGYIVEIGCHSFAIESHLKVVELLAEYMADPEKVEKQWFNNEFLLKRKPIISNEKRS